MRKAKPDSRSLWRNHSIGPASFRTFWKGEMSVIGGESLYNLEAQTISNLFTMTSEELRVGSLIVVKENADWTGPEVNRFFTDEEESRLANLYLQDVERTWSDLFEMLEEDNSCKYSSLLFTCRDRSDRLSPMESCVRNQLMILVSTFIYLFYLFVYYALLQGNEKHIRNTRTEETVSGIEKVFGSVFRSCE